MEEIWKPVRGYEGLYEVSNLGRVKALERLVLNNGGLQRKHEKILKASTTKMHLSVALCKDGKVKRCSVHRLVAIAFLENPNNKPCVDHIDTNPLNNRADNLRWVTTQENCMNPLTRINNSNSKKGHPCYLKHHSKETAEKIRQKNLGRKASEETRKKLSESHKGKKPSKESIEKHRLKMIGHSVSEETRQKIREKITGVHKGKHWKIENGKRVWY